MCKGAINTATEVDEMVIQMWYVVSKDHSKMVLREAICHSRVVWHVVAVQVLEQSQCKMPVKW